jgi:hypothetical protein
MFTTSLAVPALYGPAPAQRKINIMRQERETKWSRLSEHKKVEMTGKEYFHSAKNFHRA